MRVIASAIGVGIGAGATLQAIGYMARACHHATYDIQQGGSLISDENIFVGLGCIGSVLMAAFPAAAVAFVLAPVARYAANLVLDRISESALHAWKRRLAPYVQWAGVVASWAACVAMYSLSIDELSFEERRPYFAIGVWVALCSVALGIWLNYAGQSFSRWFAIISAAMQVLTIPALFGSAIMQPTVPHVRAVMSQAGWVDVEGGLIESQQRVVIATAEGITMVFAQDRILRLDLHGCWHLAHRQIHPCE